MQSSSSSSTKDFGGICLLHSHLPQTTKDSFKRPQGFMYVVYILPPPLTEQGPSQESRKNTPLTIRIKDSPERRGNKHQRYLRALGVPHWSDNFFAFMPTQGRRKKRGPAEAAGR